MEVTEHHGCLDISPFIHNCEECLANCGQCLHRQRVWSQIALFCFKVGLIRFWFFMKPLHSFVDKPANEPSHQTHQFILPGRALQRGWTLHLKGKAEPGSPSSGMWWCPGGITPWSRGVMGLLCCATPHFLPLGKIIPALRQHSISCLRCLGGNA